MKTKNKLSRSAFLGYARVARTCSYSAVAVTLVAGLSTGFVALDDDIPIPHTVGLEAGVGMQIPPMSPDFAEEQIGKSEAVSLKKVAKQESVAEVKNQVAFVSTKADPAIEMSVYTYFADIPEMIYVAQCESTFRHYGADGKVLRGNMVSSDVGVMQINEYYHYDRALSLGYDVHTLEGNLHYARFLYEEQGLQPWSASKFCWSKKHKVAEL